MKTQIAGHFKAGLIPLLLAPGLLLAAQPEAGTQAAQDREQRLEVARQRLEEAAREVAELSLDQNGMRDVLRLRTFVAGRAALGINIARQEGQRREAEGVPVVSVSPGGPAAAAGIKAGDVLLSVNGRSLKAENGRTPQAVLLDFMSSVEPGTTVAVEYRRDGKTAKADVVAQPLRPELIAGTAALPVPGMMGGGMDAIGMTGPAFTFFRDPDTFGAMELVTLTPKLGQYFGTEQGLLVVRAPVDSRFGLEDGDVIVDIAGRVPSNPAHAMRILGSYQAGEKLTLNILRQKKRIPVGVEVPADARRGDVQFQQFRQAVPLPVPGTPAGGAIFNAPVPAPPAPAIVRPLPSLDDRV